MRLAAFLLPLTLLLPTVASADEPEAAAEASATASPDASATPEPAAADDGPSRRENRVKDHAIGLGYYYTHMQWHDMSSGATPQVDYHALAVRYAYYIGQAQRFGFIINSAATIPMRAEQSGYTSNPTYNGGYSVLGTYDRHVGFDLGFMAGTHRMLTPNLAAIAGLGIHVGMVKLNQDDLSIHEYIALGIASVFSLRYRLGELMTVGVDVNASSDYRDMIDHRDPLDWTINLGVTATAGMHF